METRRIALGVGIVIALVPVAGLAGGFLLPDRWHVEREVTIAAPPEAIHAIAGDLSRWESWTAWNRSADPAMKRDVQGSGPGAVMTWEGPRVGTGRLTVTSSDPQKGLAYDLVLEEDGFPSRGEIRYAPVEGGTKVTWTDDGTLTRPFAVWFGPMIRDLVGADFDAGLAKLKTQVETH